MDYINTAFSPLNFYFASHFPSKIQMYAKLLEELAISLWLENGHYKPSTPSHTKCFLMTHKSDIMSVFSLYCSNLF